MREVRRDHRKSSIYNCILQFDPTLLDVKSVWAARGAEEGAAHAPAENPYAHLGELPPDEELPILAEFLDIPSSVALRVSSYFHGNGFNLLKLQRICRRKLSRVPVSLTKIRFNVEFGEVQKDLHAEGIF